jgi:16S rRNA (adenine1518-N6/adenine1519-N6)-dimethyltransferase
MKEEEQEKEDGKYFLKAKKSLGQHFLRSEKALMTMVESIKRDGEIVFEIGPGEGVLTEKLLQSGYTVIVVEIDKRSIEILKQKFASEIENKKLFIIESDCLEIDYSKILKSFKKTSDYSLLGNIPYYITGAIFRHTFEQKVLPKLATFLVQKEVAQRIVAQNKKESLLSVSVKIYGEAKLLEIVKRGSFAPPPKVDSAIISISNIHNPFKNTDSQEIFFKILKACFSHKRKFLLTNLKTDLDKDSFDKYFLKIQEIVLKYNNEKARAEDMSLDVWKEIISFL